MKIENNLNYTILSDAINQNLLNNFKDYTILNDNLTYQDVEDMIYSFPSKTVVLNDLLRKFKTKEKEKIIDLLRVRGVNFINITSFIEEAIYGDYIFVYYDNKIVIEGATKEVLKSEKLLKRLGFGLPFAMDLSTQLKLYQILDKEELDLRKLVDTLWN